MGRKIPAKKHRGVKDPLKQQEQRLQRLKTKINAPPNNPDEQPVPRSLQRLFGLRDDRHLHKHKAKLNRKTVAPPVTARRSESTGVRDMRRLPGESARSFSQRITATLRALSAPQHYPLEVAEEPEDEKEARGERRRRRRREARGEEGSTQPRPHRFTLAKLQRKEKLAQAAVDNSERCYERVPFGEVAHGPPTLPLPRRHAARPGQRPLLLSALLGAAPPAPAPRAAPRPAPALRAAPRPAPRLRALPAAERERRERASRDAVFAYRTLKAQNAVKAQHTTANIKL